MNARDSFYENLQNLIEHEGNVNGLTISDAIAVLHTVTHELDHENPMLDDEDDDDDEGNSPYSSDNWKNSGGNN